MLMKLACLLSVQHSTLFTALIFEIGFGRSTKADELWFALEQLHLDAYDCVQVQIVACNG